MGRIDAVTGLMSTVAGGYTIGSAGAPPGDGGPATQAILGEPFGLALDGQGNLFVSEQAGHRVRRVSLATGVISTVAGNGVRGFSGDGGPATAASLCEPSAIAFDRDRSLLIADSCNGRIRRVDGQGTIRTIAGTGADSSAGDGGPATAASLRLPRGLAVSASGEVFVADERAHVIRRIGLDGTIAAYAGRSAAGFHGDGGPATLAAIAGPRGLVFDPRGDLLILDTGNLRVRRVDRQSGILTTFVGSTNADGAPLASSYLYGPSNLARGPAGELYISEYRGNRVRRLAPGGTLRTVAGTGARGSAGDGGPATLAELNGPEGLAFDAAGNLLIAEGPQGYKVRRLDLRTGLITTVLGNGKSGVAGDNGPAAEALIGPTGIRVSGDDLYIADTQANRIRAVFACRGSLGAFDAVYPTDGLVSEAPTLNLSWGRSQSAFLYDLVIDTEFPPKKVVESDLDGVGVARALEPGKTYYWQVRAKGDPHCPPVSRASPVRRLSTPTPCVAPAAPRLNDTAPGLSPVLSFQGVADASSYDVYLGSGVGSRLLAAGLTSTSVTAPGLAPGTTYRWRAVARGACNPALTTSSAEGTFTTPGACEAPAAARLSAPAAGASGLARDIVLRWSAADGAETHDVYLDEAAADGAVPFASGVVGGSLLVALDSGRSYSWRVVSRGACDPGKTATSETRRFSTASACLAPGRVSATGSASATAGSTYTLSWGGAEGLGSNGLYRVERSTAPDLSGAEVTVTARTSATLRAERTGTYHHRIVAVASCGASSTPSQVVSTAVGSAPPFLVVAAPPRGAAIRQVPSGEELPRLELPLANTGGSDFVGFFNTSQAVPFFTLSETVLSLRPGETRLVYLQLTGVPGSRAGQYEGLVSMVSADPSDSAAYPLAGVSLNVTGLPPNAQLSGLAAPDIQQGGAPVELVRFVAGEPDPTVSLRNPGSAPLELAADVTPDPWVSLEPGWNASPIPPGASRTVALRAERARGKASGSLPRHAYVTFRTVDGQSSRLLVLDADRPEAGPCRGRAPLEAGEVSLIVPSLVNANAQGGGRYVSRLLLTNLGPEPLQADLFYTPDTGDQGTSGFACDRVLSVSLLVPGLDVLALDDPLGELFGVFGSGQLEVRSSRIGQLAVQSVVDAPAPSGGSFGFQLPTAVHGEGARAGRPQVVAGARISASFRTNLILAETAGQPASVSLTLYDAAAQVVGRATRTLPPYGKKQLPLAELAGGRALEAGAVEIEAEPGSAGAVVGVLTTIDNRSGDASSFLSRPLAAATRSTEYVVPSVVFTGTFRSRFEVRNNEARPVTLTLTYRGSTGSVSLPQRVLPPRAMLAADNVLAELFGLPSGTFGPLSIASDSAHLSVVTRVYADAGSGSYGDTILGFALDDPVTTGGGRLLAVDGLEGSADGNRNRGARTNLILTEIAGGDVEIEVSLWEKTSRRTAPSARRTLTVPAHGQVQINDVFGSLGLGRKDNLNVRCQALARPGSTGRVLALATRIDNKTNDTKNLLLSP